MFARWEDEALRSVKCYIFVRWEYEALRGVMREDVRVVGEG